MYIYNCGAIPPIIFEGANTACQTGVPSPTLSLHSLISFSLIAPKNVHQYQSLTVNGPKTDGTPVDDDDDDRQ